MDDATRLLGSLLGGSLGRGLTSQAGMAVGMGLLGVAMAAYEHYTQQKTAGGAATGGPPPPPAGPAAAVPPPPGGAHPDALLLIRAMVAAASADGVIDADERARIAARADAAGLGAETRETLERELAAPQPLEHMLATVTSPQLAEEVYAVSLAAIRPDSEPNRAYLDALARALALDAAAVARLHLLVGVPQP